jgi:hypothetical protein
MTDSTNPLLEPQREKSGASTMDKYRYQYHWALYKVLSEHQARKEYAVFVELHEDVVICDSLDSTKAKFELNQVKTTNKNISHNELVKLKEKVKGTSVLSKLVCNSHGKAYSDKIKFLNLVSVYPFTLELKKEGLTLEKITLEDLSDSQLKKLEEAIEDELGKGISLPSNLQFIVSNLSEKNYQNDVIASISKLISELYPEALFNPIEIYRLLIDELNNKGIVTYDFTKWEDLISKKALTSTTITRVINSFTNLKDEAKIHAEFNDIASELSLNTITKRKVQNSFDAYRLQRLENKSLAQSEITKNITVLIQDELSSGEESIQDLISSVADKLDDKYKKRFLTKEDLEGAIICEFILQ